MGTNWSKVGRRSKNKGKAYERLVAKNLTDFTKVNFRKTPSSGGWNKQGVVVAGHVFCGDLICDAKDFKFSVEAKNRKEFSFQQILKNISTAPFTEWWFQTVRDAKEHSLEPMLWFKPKPGSTDNLVALSAKDWQKKLPQHILLPAYKPAVEFTTYEKSPKEKSSRNHRVKARLPIPIIVHWAHIKNNLDPNELFGSPEVKDYGRIIKYN